MLNAEITITDTVKILSDMFVYVNIIEITNKLINVITKAIPLPNNIFIPLPLTDDFETVSTFSICTYLLFIKYMLSTYVL